MNDEKRKDDQDQDDTQAHIIEGEIPDPSGVVAGDPYDVGGELFFKFMGPIIASMKASKPPEPVYREFIAGVAGAFLSVLRVDFTPEQNRELVEGMLVSIQKYGTAPAPREMND